MRRVLVIEDDEDIIKLMKLSFEKELDTEFTYFSDYNLGLATIVNESFDLYIIDLNIAGYDGLNLLKVLQKEKNIVNRVVVVSADQGAEARVKSYELGVANFLIKPLHMNVLRAVMRKNLKALDQFSDVVIETQYHTLQVDEGLCLFKETRESIPLTPGELKILKKLMENRGRTVKGEDLKVYLEKNDRFVSDKALQMHISSLRKKIGKERIQNKRGFGYSYLE